MSLPFAYGVNDNAEAAHLLTRNDEDMELSDMTSHRNGSKEDATRVDTRYTDRSENEGQSSSGVSRQEWENDMATINPRVSSPEYRVYGIRWFGLIQLVLLNVIVSWDWLSFAPVANSAADFYSTDPSVINWLSTAFLFAFVAATPWTIYTLHHGGPRRAIITSSVLIVIGNWIRYGGTRASAPSFGLTMFGQILIGLAQPFVLSAPTHYSDLWFTPQGRVSATAIMSLANPLGGALGQLINPALATKSSQIPSMTLYVAIISTAISLPSFLVPAKPRTPVSASSTYDVPTLRETIHLLIKNPTFWLLVIPYWTYVGFFNSISSLLTQILTPYGFSETESGIAGAVLILVGLLSAAITSPIVDRTKSYLHFIKILTPIIALSYLAFIWAPGTRSIAAPYVILAVLGAASFSLVPNALEFLVEVTFPIGPEATSTICWSGGQLFGGVFILISDALKADKDASPPFTMSRALIFQAVVAAAALPCAMILGWVGNVGSKRLQVDKASASSATRDEVE